MLKGEDIVGDECGLIGSETHRVQMHTKQLSCSKTPHQQIKSGLFHSDEDSILRMNPRPLLGSRQEEVIWTNDGVDEEEVNETQDVALPGVRIDAHPQSVENDLNLYHS